MGERNEVELGNHPRFSDSLWLTRRRQPSNRGRSKLRTRFSYIIQGLLPFCYSQTKTNVPNKQHTDTDIDQGCFVWTTTLSRPSSPPPTLYLWVSCFTVHQVPRRHQVSISFTLDLESGHGTRNPNSSSLSSPKPTSVTRQYKTCSVLSDLNPRPFP